MNSNTYLFELSVSLVHADKLNFMLYSSLFCRSK